MRPERGQSSKHGGVRFAAEKRKKEVNTEKGGFEEENVELSV